MGKICELCFGVTSFWKKTIIVYLGLVVFMFATKALQMMVYGQMDYFKHNIGPYSVLILSWMGVETLLAFLLGRFHLWSLESHVGVVNNVIEFPRSREVNPFHVETELSVTQAFQKWNLSTMKK